jgi:phosphoglucomutase
MTIETIATVPIPGPKPGTSGLRKKTAVFMPPGYPQNHVQAVTMRPLVEIGTPH